MTLTDKSSYSHEFKVWAARLISAVENAIQTMDNEITCLRAQQTALYRFEIDPN